MDLKKELAKWNKIVQDDLGYANSDMLHHLRNNGLRYDFDLFTWLFDNKVDRDSIRLNINNFFDWYDDNDYIWNFHVPHHHLKRFLTNSMKRAGLTKRQVNIVWAYFEEGTFKLAGERVGCTRQNANRTFQRAMQKLTIYFEEEGYKVKA